MRGGLRYALDCAGWVVLFVLSLGAASDALDQLVVPAPSRADYAAYVAIVGFLIVMPLGLIVGSLVPGIWRRSWLFWLLAPLLAAATAVFPVAVG